jgi:phage terminase large subunit GpA-like protein
MTATDIDYLIEINQLKKIEPPEKLISKFIEKKRIMPSGTPYPGPVDLRLTPYAIEWMDNMSPYSGITHQVIEKAAQIAATFAVECIIGYWMREMPTAIQYMSATDQLLKKWGTKRLEPMIDSIGMRKLISDFSEIQFGSGSRRTADTIFSKQFLGGFLELASAQSPSSQRSDSIRVMIRDEIDGAPRMLVTGEGNWLITSEARLKFWGDRMKITDLSTPTTYELSSIHDMYLDGDCRVYLFPCPLCGHMQFLFWLPETGNHGLRADTVAGKIERVYYLCEKCHDAIFEKSKYKMLNDSRSKWEPTKESKSKTYRSYNINSLYAPLGTYSWKKYYEKWLISRDDPGKMRGFTNTDGGQPYREEGSRPKIENVISLRGNYKSGQVLNEVLWITAGSDVQRGKKSFELLSDSDLERTMEEMKKSKIDLHHQGLPRIELEMLGNGHGYRTYSIEYKVFYGHTHDPYSGAWEKLRRWLIETELVYTRLDGSRISCQIMFIDSGDGERTSAVYQFCEPYPGIFPIKGDQALKKGLHEKGDELMQSSFRRYSVSKIGDAQFLYTVATNHYKNKIYHSLKIPRQPTEEQRPGFMEFPIDYSDYYFKMLTAEERHFDGSFHSGSRRNEALVCRAYALCASDVWLDNQVNKVREAYIKQGIPRDKVRAAYTHANHIEFLKRKRYQEMATIKNPA